MDKPFYAYNTEQQTDSNAISYFVINPFLYSNGAMQQAELIKRAVSISPTADFFWMHNRSLLFI